MSVERHLILQEQTLLPSGEWKPLEHEWVVARVAEGNGYWLSGGARELNVGDGFVAGCKANPVVRASQLGFLKLQFFTVQPQYLSGLLTVTEWHQLESASDNPLARVLFFTDSEPLGQKFARLAAQTPTEGLFMRCTLLQLWSGAVTSLIGLPSASAGSYKLRERIRQLVGQMPEAELSKCSLSGIAGQLHCSERHFSRLFREEFGVPFRTRQIELRLLHAQQLLANSDAKIINVAYDSGYRHLGLFNAMFKKRFGVTPSKWRQQNLRKNGPAKSIVRAAVLVLLFALNLILPVRAQTEPAAPPVSADSEAMAQARAALLQKMAELDAKEKDTRVHLAFTNTGPTFDVEKYLVQGNTVLPPEMIDHALTNVDGAFGTNACLPGIRAALAELQRVYRERGYVTVSVGLPQQKLTNATVKVKVVEGRLAAINVTGNFYFSSNNVMHALPSLHTNLLLNSHVFQRELDVANASRDRQIYPVIGPGPEPDTSELTLKVKDRLPLHARLELNNEATPDTPDLRVNFSAQYDNLWDLEHQIGIQYNFTPDRFKSSDPYYESVFDYPLIANYSVYYRLPLGGYRSVEQQVEANPGSFGYNEVTHQFQMPPPTGRPELTLYASRSTSDTGVQMGPLGTNSVIINTNLVALGHRTAGENVTLNEGLGFKLSLPLPTMDKLVSTLSMGADYKHYDSGSANADLFYELISTTNNSSAIKYGNVLYTLQTVRQPQVDYYPLNVGWNGSVPDSLGTTFLNALANFNVFPVSSVGYFPVTTTNYTTGTNGAVTTNVVTTTKSGHGDSFSSVAYTTNARPNYVTLRLGADRVQTIYKEWAVKLHADGQWANEPLFSNEQYAMGGMAGVRGYQDGQAYGDTGWRFSIEPQTPLINIGMFGNEGHVEPCWLRASVFLDYGQIYLLNGCYTSKTNYSGSLPHISYVPHTTQSDYCGTGFGITANIGSHLDGRLTVAWPLISHAGEDDGVHIYFGVGAQF